MPSPLKGLKVESVMSSRRGGMRGAVEMMGGAGEVAGVKGVREREGARDGKRSERPRLEVGGGRWWLGRIQRGPGGRAARGRGVCGVTVELSTSEDAFAVPRPGGVKFSPNRKVGWGDMGARVWVASRTNLNRRSSIIIVPDTLDSIPDFSGQQKWSSQWRAEKKRRPKLSKEQEERKKEARHVASARYRERNREAVLQAGRERAAHRHAYLRALKPGHQDLEAAHSRAREAGARYRAQNRESLAVKQRLPESSGREEEDNDNAWGFGRPDPNYIAPRICDYKDPFLRL
ncbi:hypothetical protein K438DRAFT_2151356 [Mycena galopus ATCC 62051]|nr:hypothetical protein K438DRAFT_2151356 [Mycena galopus ATCC 62051]